MLGECPMNVYGAVLSSGSASCGELGLGGCAGRGGCG